MREIRTPAASRHYITFLVTWTVAALILLTAGLVMQSKRLAAAEKALKTCSAATTACSMKP